MYFYAFSRAALNSFESSPNFGSGDFSAFEVWARPTLRFYLSHIGS